MIIKRILCVILSTVMLACAPNAVSATNDSRETEAEPQRGALICYMRLTGEETGTRQGRFTGLTRCGQVCDVCGFLDIRIEKLYGDTWRVFDEIYGDDLEYDVSECSFSHYYNFPIRGHYRIYARHYAEDGGNFFGGPIIDFHGNASKSFFVV